MRPPNVDELRKLIADGAVLVIVCAAVTNPLKLAGATIDSCKLCGRAVQVSPRGQEQMKAGKCWVVCNPCGIALAEIKADQGRLRGVVLSEETEAALARGSAVYGEQVELLRMAFPFDPTRRKPS